MNQAKPAATRAAADGQPAPRPAGPGHRHHPSAGGRLRPPRHQPPHGGPADGGSAAAELARSSPRGSSAASTAAASPSPWWRTAA
jgi:hypothetical protein